MVSAHAGRNVSDKRNLGRSWDPGIIDRMLWMQRNPSNNLGMTQLLYKFRSDERQVSPLGEDGCQGDRQKLNRFFGWAPHNARCVLVSASNLMTLSKK
jgi:hypothetical protein